MSKKVDLKKRYIYLFNMEDYYKLLSKQVKGNLSNLYRKGPSIKCYDYCYTFKKKLSILKMHRIRYPIFV